MTTQTPDGNESIDLEPRTERALSECMTVLEDVGRARDAPGLYVVVGENAGGEYLVDVHTGACECPDAEYRNPGGGCKHVRRVRMAVGETPVPAGVDVDDALGEHVDATPQVAATDGGIVDAGDDAEILDESGSDDGRPDDCSCLATFDTLSCFACYQAGFKEPNPDAPEDGDVDR